MKLSGLLVKLSGTADFIRLKFYNLRLFFIHKYVEPLPKFKSVLTKKMDVTFKVTLKDILQELEINN